MLRKANNITTLMTELEAESLGVYINCMMMESAMFREILIRSDIPSVTGAKICSIPVAERSEANIKR